MSRQCLPLSAPSALATALAIAMLALGLNPARADAPADTAETLDRIEEVGRSLSGTYYADEAAGAKTALPLRELPQSVRVLSRQAIDDLGALRFSGQANLEAVHSERARHVTRAAQIDELVLQLQRHADLPGLGADRGVDLRAGGGQRAEQKHRGGEQSGSNVHWSNHLTSL
jgi:hypothetical protein